MTLFRICVMNKKLFFLLLLFLPITCCASTSLFKNGVSLCDIVLCKNASESERTAANELSEYLSKISGAKFRVVDSQIYRRKAIFVGCDDNTVKLLGIKRPDDNDEGFYIIARNGNLYIAGGRKRGTMYGVYRFLDEKLGVRWYTKDFVKVPRLKKFEMNDFEEHEEPAFPYRSVLYYTSLHNIDWNAHNMINSILGASSDNIYGGIQGYLGVHTMTAMVSAKEYFKKHPEYFAQYDGKRIDNGQLCLSNPNVIKILISRTLDEIKKYPNCWCYSVSQDDNLLFCQCKRCVALEKKYGGHSGLLIWAINQIADAVSKEYPNVKIGTLAYHSTQEPPRNIYPRPNVKIRFCMDGCYSHPLNAAENKVISDNLLGWHKLTSNIVIWDYSTNFYHYLMPVPNINRIAANMELFKSLNLQGVMEMGQYDAYGGEFFELKQWIMAKLLWSPTDDPDSLARDFIYGVYGKAADNVMRYYNLTKQLGIKNHFIFDTRYDTPFYTEEYLNTSRRLLDEALQKEKKDTVGYANVEKLRASILYLQVMRNKPASMINGDAEKLKQFFLKYKWEEREGKPYTDFVQKMSYW